MTIKNFTREKLKKAILLSIPTLLIINGISCIRKDEIKKNTIRESSGLQLRNKNLNFKKRKSGTFGSSKVTSASLTKFKKKLFNVFENFIGLPKSLPQDDVYVIKFNQLKKDLYDNLEKYVKYDKDKQVLIKNGKYIAQQMWLGSTPLSIKKSEAYIKDDKRYNFNDYLTEKVNDQTKWNDYIDRYFGRFSKNFIEKEKILFEKKIKYADNELKAIVIEGIKLQRDIIDTFIELCKKYKDDFAKYLFGIKNNTLIINGKKNYFWPMMQNFTKKLCKVMSYFSSFKSFCPRLQGATDRYLMEDPEGIACHALFKHLRETCNFVFRRIDSCFKNSSPSRKLRMAGILLKTVGIKAFITINLRFQKKIKKRQVELILDVFKIYIEMGIKLVEMFNKENIQEVLNGFLK